MNKNSTLDDRQFSYLKSKALDLAGIHLPDSKRTMVINRLKPRMMVLNLSGVDEYIRFLTENEDDERQHFVNAITTTMSHFYREHHHYECVLEEVSQIDNKFNSYDYRVWSAGCSSGEEPYTMAMLLNHKNLRNCQYHILATDINTQMLVAAREGVYRWSDICDVPSEYIENYFTVFKNELNQERYEVCPEIKEMVNLKKFNLMTDFKQFGTFDVILCRNVMIYFDDDTRNDLIDRFIRQLRPNGLFITGHSEVFDYQSRGLTLIGKTIYKKGDKS